MKAKEFIKWAEEYFGVYRPIVKAEVLNELSTWMPDEISELRVNAKEGIETQYKTPPDVHFVVNSKAHWTWYFRRSEEAQERKEIADKKERESILEERRVALIEYDKPGGQGEKDRAQREAESEAKDAVILSIRSESSRFFTRQTPSREMSKTKITEDFEAENAQ